MSQALIYALVSAIVVSLISVFAAIPLLITKEVSKRLELFLLSMSVGALLGVVFLDFIPEMSHEGYTEYSAIVIMLGLIFFFILEKLIHYHHTDGCEKKEAGHGHAYHLAPINLIGDGIHNFIDGIVIASTFMVSPALGFSTTASVIFHEIPQEMADFGIILYSGHTKKKAILLNFLSALTAILGVVVAFALSKSIDSFSAYIIPFACGSFIYIAASNLIPELHRHCGLRATVEHLLGMIIGIALIYGVSLIGGGHTH
jgi:zinc and cadmium transporter